MKNLLKKKWLGELWVLVMVKANYTLNSQRAFIKIFIKTPPKIFSHQ